MKATLIFALIAITFSLASGQDEPIDYSEFFSSDDTTTDESDVRIDYDELLNGFEDKDEVITWS